MRVALVNPPWTFDGSIYFGCREPHLSIEYGYARQLLERTGHEVVLIDAQLEGLELPQVRQRIEHAQPQLTVLTTAPSYLFWRCAPPELRVAQLTAESLRDVAGTIVVVGPHASATPMVTLRRLGATVCVLGECEEVLVELANHQRDQWSQVSSIAYIDRGMVRIQGGPRVSDLDALPSLRWPAELLHRHTHHHNRFDAKPNGPGAEIEFSREYRDQHRRRRLSSVLDEIDALAALGVQYFYFIDETFLPDRDLLTALPSRDLRFGARLQIDDWSRESLELLGAAGCVSIEARIDKDRRLPMRDLSGLLVQAKSFVPFVQATLSGAREDDPKEIESWRHWLAARGVWASKPAPMFAYPGTPEYRRRWGAPDECAWERAVKDYLEREVPSCA